MVTSRKIDKIVEARASIIVLASPKRDVISPVRRELKKLIGKERTCLAFTAEKLTKTYEQYKEE